MGYMLKAASLFLCQLVLAGQAWAVDPVCFECGQDDETPYLSLAAQQFHARDYGHKESVKHRRLSLRGRKLFRDTMGLIRKHYVERLSEREILTASLEKLALILPPRCLEEVPRVKGCRDDPETCFSSTLSEMAAHCKLDPESLLLSALNFLLSDLDHNSSLLDPGMLREVRISTSGKFGGIGMVVTRRGDDYVVISSIEGTPAHKAGIRGGDIVLEIDGERIRGMPLPRVLRKVRGPAGSSIRVTLKNKEEGTIRSHRLKRKLIRIGPVRSAVLPGGIGYLRIVNFQETTAREVRRALYRMNRGRKRRLQSLILDLRDNPGGLFDQAIKVADLFLSSGVIISVRGHYARLNRDFKAKRAGTFRQVPMVVLVNRGSASASEILAAALQARPHVLLMGERSFGKASVQGVFLLGRGMALRLTTARYYTPGGENIDGGGVVPDILINPIAKEGQAKNLGLFTRKQGPDDKWVAAAREYLAPSRATNHSVFSSFY